MELGTDQKTGEASTGQHLGDTKATLPGKWEWVPSLLCYLCCGSIFLSSRNRRRRCKRRSGGGGQVVGGDTRWKMRADMRRASILETHAGSGSRFGILSNVTVLVIGGPGSPHDGRAVAAVFHSRDARRSGHLHKCENPGKLSGKYAKRSRMCKVAFESLPLQEKVFFLYSESRLFIFCF